MGKDPANAAVIHDNVTMAKPILLFKDFLCFVKNHNGKPASIQATEDLINPIKSLPPEKYEIKIGNIIVMPSKASKAPRTLSIGFTLMKQTFY